MFQNKYDINNKHLHSLEELEKDGRIQMGRGNVISKQDMQQCPGDYPVYSSAANNNGLIGTYGNYMFDDERLTWSIDGGGRWFYRNGEKYSVTNVGGWLKVLDPNINTRYLYHALSSQWVKKEYDYIHKALPSIIKDDYIVPIPPLAVQEEIVRILDKFTELEAELEAELEKEMEARKKQYEWYRDRLLSFDESVPMVKLENIATDIYRGAGIKKDEVTSGGIPCVRYGEIYTSYDISFTECISHTQENVVSAPKYFEHGDILFTITGESIEEIGKSIAYLGYEKCMAGGDIVVMKHNQEPRYISYALSTTAAQMQKSKGKVKSKVVHSSVPALKEIEIPLPDIATQKRIADLLDSFHALCSDITTGLPAEIAARRKQYEYYRDKLLSFEEVA